MLRIAIFDLVVNTTFVPVNIVGDFGSKLTMVRGLFLNDVIILEKCKSCCVSKNDKG